MYFGSYDTDSSVDLSSIWDHLHELQIVYAIPDTGLYITIPWNKASGNGKYVNGYYFSDKYYATVAVTILNKTVTRITDWNVSCAGGVVVKALKYWIYYK